MNTCPSCGWHLTLVGRNLVCAACRVMIWSDESGKSETSPSPEPEHTINGSVIGYRAFRIIDWKLGGTGVNRTWEPGVNRATCNRGTPENPYSAWFYGPSHSHDAPGDGCHCGITALARFATTDDHWQGDLVYGAIEAWGEDETGDSEHSSPGFILHGNGFRARYGKVVLLAIDDDWPAAKKAAVRVLVAEHEADMCKREHLEDAAKEHGQLVPDDLLEWAHDDPEHALDAGAGAFVPPMYLMGSSQFYANTSSITFSSLQQVGQQLGWSPISGAKPSVPSQSRKGIKETLGYVGPPGHGTYKRGDRVKDRRGTVYECVKGGRPGTWERA